MVLLLHKVLRRYCHIVPQIIKTELVIGTECNVGPVGPLAGIRVRLVLVYTVNLKAMELVKGPHPLRVTF